MCKSAPVWTRRPEFSSRALVSKGDAGRFIYSEPQSPSLCKEDNKDVPLTRSQASGVEVMES